VNVSQSTYCSVSEDCSPINENQRFEALINSQSVDRAPVICTMHSATSDLMRSADAFFPYVQDDPVKMARLAKAGHDVAGFENVRVPFDESVEVSAFNVATGMKGLQRTPMVLESLVNDLDDLESLQVPDPRTSGKVPAVLKAVDILQSKMRDVPIFLGIITPWTLATQLRGETVCLLDMVNENRLLEGLLERSTDFILEYVKEASRRGVDQIVLEEPMANENVMDLEMFRKFVEPYEDIIANEMRGEGIESMLHISGAFSEEQLERIVEVDVDALCVDECVEISMAKRFCDPRGMLVFGNLCTTSVLLNGNRRSVQSAVKRCLSEGADAVAPGDSLELHTPTDNLVAMTAAVKRTGTKKRRRGA
jgi:[methyl-Co(III) methylamine-specific corrinoid protein]:coenzyme M methyltransferase